MSTRARKKSLGRVAYEASYPDAINLKWSEESIWTRQLFIRASRAVVKAHEARKKLASSEPPPSPGTVHAAKLRAKCNTPHYSGQTPEQWAEFCDRIYGAPMSPQKPRRAGRGRR